MHILDAAVLHTEGLRTVLEGTPRTLSLLIERYRGEGTGYSVRGRYPRHIHYSVINRPSVARVKRLCNVYPSDLDTMYPIRL
jgi:hypothetical protein